MLNARWPLVLLVGLVASLGPVLGLEFGVRALIATERLPEAPAKTRFAEVSLNNLQQAGAPDVLIIGTSVTRNGIEPRVLRDALGQVGLEADVRSVAIAGISLSDQLILVEEFAERDLLPPVAIVGLSSRSFTGIQDDLDWFGRSILGRYWAGCGDVEGWELLLDCGLSQVSALWRWRGEADRLMTAVTDGMPRQIRSFQRNLRPDGFYATRPRKPGGLLKDVPRSVDKLRGDATVTDKVVADYSALVAALETDGVTVIPVFIPYAVPLETALLERNPDYRRDRRASMATLREATGVPIVEVEGFGPWFGADSMRDLRHMSRVGARGFTRQLWERSDFRSRLMDALAGDSA